MEEGRREGRKEVKEVKEAKEVKERRKEGKTEGNKEGKTEGKTEGRKGGRKEVKEVKVPCFRCVSSDLRRAVLSFSISKRRSSSVSCLLRHI